MASEVYVGRVRSVVVLFLLTIVTAGIYFFIWLAQANGELRRNLGEDRSPAGRFFLFLLVPVIGWVLVLWWMARDVRRIQLNANLESLVVPVYHGVWALVPFVGWWIAMGYIQRGLNRAWTKMNQVFGVSGTAEAEVQCPDCDGRFLAFFNPLMPRPVQCPSCGRVGAV